MTDFDPTDPFDPELAAALRHRARGDGGSTRAAHTAVLERASTIRRRRAAVVGGGALALLLVGGVALLPRGGADELAPAVSGDVLPSFDDPTAPPPDTVGDDAAPVTVDVPIPPVTETSEHAQPDATDTADDTSSIPLALPTTDATERPSTVPSPAPDSSTPSIPSTSSAPSTVGTPSDSAPSTPPAPTTSEPDTSSSTPDPGLAPFTRTYTSGGGSITVAWDGSSLTLSSVAPAGGYTAEIEDQAATRVRVRFRGDRDHRIEVRIVDGRAIVDID